MAQDLWLYGQHPVRAALGNLRRHVRAVFAEKPAQWHELAHTRNVPVTQRSNRDLSAMLVDAGSAAHNAIHQGVVLQCRPLKTLSLATFLSAPRGESTLVLVLDQITDPRNVGAILRSAEAFGASAILTALRHTPPETAVMAKAASGALDALEHISVPNIARALQSMKQNGFWVFGLTQDGTVPLSSMPCDCPNALVIGSEGRGIRPLVLAQCDQSVRIPMHPQRTVDSLNVAQAACVALFQWSTTCCPD